MGNEADSAGEDVTLETLRRLEEELIGKRKLEEEAWELRAKIEAVKRERRESETVVLTPERRQHTASQEPPPVYARQQYPIVVTSSWKPLAGTVVGGIFGAAGFYLLGVILAPSLIVSAAINRDYNALNFAATLPLYLCGGGGILGSVGGFLIGNRSFQKDLRRAGYQPQSGFIR